MLEIIDVKTHTHTHLTHAPGIHTPGLAESESLILNIELTFYINEITCFINNLKVAWVLWRGCHLLFLLHVSR